MTHQFVDRFTKDVHSIENHKDAKHQAFDRLESIIDTCKSLLNITDYKGMFAHIGLSTYMRLSVIERIEHSTTPCRKSSYNKCRASYSKPGQYRPVYQYPFQTHSP